MSLVQRYLTQIKKNNIQYKLKIAIRKNNIYFKDFEGLDLILEELALYK